MTTRHLVGVLLVLAAAGCHRQAPVPPADPVLEALRAEEQTTGLGYAEGKGQHLFEHYCATCHGDGGKGDGQNASNLNPPAPDLTDLEEPRRRGLRAARDRRRQRGGRTLAPLAALGTQPAAAGDRVPHPLLPGSREETLRNPEVDARTTGNTYCYLSESSRRLRPGWPPRRANCRDGSTTSHIAIP